MEASTNIKTEDFRALFEKIYPMVRSIARRYLREKFSLIGNDLISEILITVFQNIEKAPKEGRIETWVYRIAVNKSVDMLRKNAAKSRYEVDYNFEIDNLEAVENEINSINSRKYAFIMREVIPKLPSEDQQLILSDLEGISLEEIAEKRGVSRDSLVKHKGRLMKKLRQKMENIDIGDDINE